jgi:5-methylthioribose kinase
MLSTQEYRALTLESLPVRLSEVDSVVARVGPDPATWAVKEIGDGNLNLVFVVEGPAGSVVVKQALPYVRLVGESWPLPLYRAFFEHHALVQQAKRDPGVVPEIFHFDEAQALIVMERLTPHRILRQMLIDGECVPRLGPAMGRFCARTAFRGSELSMKSADKKADVSLFAGNVEIPAITEALVFTDPYYAAEMNQHTAGLDPVVSQLRRNTTLKVRVQRMLMKFASNTETMVHGDLHSGSIMATADEVRVIDPEFAQYGPFGFDIGMLVANYLMAYFSQPAHRGSDLNDYQDWLLAVVADTFENFEAEYRRLWVSERTGMLFPTCLFEDQGQDSTAACNELLEEIRADAITICGIEMHRRVLSLAHNADFESIEDPAIRAPLEARNLTMGTDLILRAQSIKAPAAICDMARQYNRRDCL